jgi:hypothetical protein
LATIFVNLALAAVLAIGAPLSGCAIQLDARTPLYRDTSAPSRDNEPSLGAAARLAPVRNHGVVLGGELETHLRAAAPNASPSTIEIANLGLVAGYVIHPGWSGRFIPGFEGYAITSFGEPAGHPVERGVHYRVGAGTALLLPLTPRDVESGMVLFGYAIEWLVEARASVWAPPEGSSSGVLGEHTLGLGLRVRAFSDLVSSGHPRRKVAE